MKIFRVFFAIALISVIAISCKETKKGAEEDLKEATEQVEKAAEETGKAIEEATEEVKVVTEEGTKKAEESIETTTKGIVHEKTEENLIEETVADTPVIYPGCEGTVEEIRACSKKEFKKFFAKNFNIDLANDLDMDTGDHRIRTLLRISESGKISVMAVEAENEALKNEIIRVINKYPIMTPATKGGTAIPVSFILPVDFKVE
ncbi:MAG: hypothetical protein ABFR05_01105 [Bacteroidota bacterium]